MCKNKCMFTYLAKMHCSQTPHETFATMILSPKCFTFVLAASRLLCCLFVHCCGHLYINVANSIKTCSTYASYRIHAFTHTHTKNKQKKGFNQKNIALYCYHWSKSPVTFNKDKEKHNLSEPMITCFKNNTEA